MRAGGQRKGPREAGRMKQVAESDPAASGAGRVS